MADSGRCPSCRKFPCTSKRIPKISIPTGAIRETLARPWAIPGTPGLEHRIGGLEKQDVTGNVNYEPLNHERMVRLRAAKVEAIVAGRFPTSFPRAIPPAILLIVAWGSTHGPITAALKTAAREGPVASATFICAI